MVWARHLPLVWSRLCGWIFCRLHNPTFENILLVKVSCSRRRHRVMPREPTRGSLMISPFLESWRVFYGSPWSVLRHCFSFRVARFCAFLRTKAIKHSGGRPPKPAPRLRGSGDMFGTPPLVTVATPAVTTAAAPLAPSAPPATIVPPRRVASSRWSRVARAIASHPSPTCQCMGHIIRLLLYGRQPRQRFLNCRARIATARVNGGTARRGFRGCCSSRTCTTGRGGPVCAYPPYRVFSLSPRCRALSLCIAARRECP
jgi:hypothetical protein